jgi:hypothetical protein
MNTVKSANQLDQIETASSKDDTAFKGVAAEWVVTTQSSQWQTKDQLTVAPALNGNWDVEVHLDKPLQTVDGFGACLNELGWDSLSALNEADREAILEELFAPGVGANFNSCRMPIGANDFSRDWYSYDEVPGDFALEHFSISRDLELLVPFTKSALRYLAQSKALGLALEPSDLDEIQQALCGKVVRTRNAGQRVKTRPGRKGGHRHVHSGGSLL